MMLPYLLFTAGLISAATALLNVDDLAAVAELGGTAVILFVAGWLVMLTRYVSGVSRLHTSTSVHVDVPLGGSPGTADAALSAGVGRPGSIHPATPGVPMPLPRIGGDAAGPTFERWPYRLWESP